MALRKWAMVSDIHFPYHNKRYVDLFMQFVKDWRPTHLDLVGDIDDSCPVSKFSEGTAKETQDLAYKYAPIIQDFLGDLRSILPNSEIVFHGGNHDFTRYDAYMGRNAPALQGWITPELLWKTETHGIDFHNYQDPPVERYGGFYAHHGIYATKGGGNSVRKMMEEFGVSLITGHTHKQSIVAQTFELTGEQRTGIELGNLCDLSSSGFNYTQLRDWQPGFGYAYIDEDNNDAVYPFLASIKNNSVVIDGKKFSA